MPSQKDGNRSVERAIEILQAFSFDDDELSLAYISAQTNLPKTTALRILTTLEEKNLVMRVTEDGKYRLGYELIKLGAIAQNGYPIKTIAHPYMVEVSRETEQTCNLYIREGYQRICIEQVPGSQYVRRYSFLGARHPLYCGAGKLLLAFSEDSFIRDYLDNVKLEKITEKTITSAEKLKKELAEIREKGYSLSRGERDAATAMVSVPIRDYTRKVTAAITVSGPIVFFDDEVIKKCLTCLNKAADQVSAKLGYR